jgi:hypothetical protein
LWPASQTRADRNESFRDPRRSPTSDADNLGGILEGSSEWKLRPVVEVFYDKISLQTETRWPLSGAKVTNVPRTSNNLNYL